MSRFKTSIIIDACIEDFNDTKNDEFIRNVYEKQELFAGFKVKDSDNEFYMQCKRIAEECRNAGYSFDEMMDRLKEEIDRVQAEADRRMKIEMEKRKETESKDFSPYIIPALIICVSIVISCIFESYIVGAIFAVVSIILWIAYSHKSGSLPEKKVAAATILVIFVSICIFAYNHHQEYLENYEIAEQEIIDERYKRLMDSYNEDYEREENKKESDVEVTISDTLLYNNSVGNDWSVEHYVNGEQLDEGKNTIHVTFGKQISIKTIATEYDSIPDVGTASGVIDGTKDSLISGCYSTHNVVVTENRGRYTGSTAEWETEYEFKAIMNYPEKPDKSSITVSESDVKNRMKEKGTL
mgnify:CR=1 FL=1